MHVDAVRVVGPTNITIFGASRGAPAGPPCTLPWRTDTPWLRGQNSNPFGRRKLAYRQRRPPSIERRSCGSVLDRASLAHERDALDIGGEREPSRPPGAEFAGDSIAGNGAQALVCKNEPVEPRAFGDAAK